MADSPWYAEGIRFQCTGSGKCCTVRGDSAYVFFTRKEERTMAGHLGLSRVEFRRLHTDRLGPGEWTLHFPDGRCTFLDGRRCSIYEARPSQCRTWPFWPENMDPEVWNTEIAPFCPGVGQGPLHTQEKIEATLEEADSTD